jgi:outer membrane receptor for monomeric catechols
LSKNNVNLVGYYEKGPVGFRVAYNWRDKYFNSLNGTTGNGVFTNSYKDLSATMKYRLHKGVEVKLEGINLLNSKQRSYDGYSEGLVTNVIYGRIYKLGISMTF